MKKGLVAFLVTLIFLIGTCQAASYTLPEKMHNQLAIGSGLKGTFHVSAEGDKFDTPFLKAVTDADFSLRGITSGKDLHYYLFQSDYLFFPLLFLLLISKMDLLNLIQE